MDVIAQGFVARLYPDIAQVDRLNQWAGALRFLWNRLLERERDEYAMTGRFLWRPELQRLAIEMKKSPSMEWLADLPAHAIIDVACRLDRALRKMVAERASGRRWGFPRTKKKFVNESGIYCVGQKTSLSRKRAVVPKLGGVKMRAGRLPSGRVLSARIWRDGPRWMLSAQIEVEKPAPMPETPIQFGLDLGVSTLVTVFDGTSFIEEKAPRHLRKRLKRLRRAQRSLCRRQRGSGRRRAQIRAVASIHRKVREQRKNFLHQLTHRLTAKAGVIRVENLNVRGMTRNRGLALSVADAAMSRLVSLLCYKADWRGRTIEKISRWFPSSQACSCCGAIEPAMKSLRRRQFACQHCGHTEGRDRNAARNIYWYGQEGRNRVRLDATGGEIGTRDGASPTRGPIGEPSMCMQLRDARVAAL